MAWTVLMPSKKYKGQYRDATGKVRSVGTFVQKKAAQTAATVAEDASHKPGYRDPSAGTQTWRTWTERWWPSRSVEPGTLSRDLSRLNRHLMPRWGDTPLVDITRLDVKAWAVTLGKTRPATETEAEKKGLAVGSVQRCMHLFSASMTAAIDAEILIVNPAWRIKLATGETSAHRYLTDDETARLLDAIPDDFHKAFVSMLVGTGMRWGEAAGLQIKWVDFERKRIRVADVWDVKSKELKEYPKGKRRRNVPIPAWVASQLKLVIGDRKEGFVFEVGKGSVISHSNFRNRVWLPAIKESEIGAVRVHDLRHTYASVLINDGISLAEIGKLLGHISPLTTQKYAHLLDGDQAHILAALTKPKRRANRCFSRGDSIAPGCKKSPVNTGIEGHLLASRCITFYPVLL